MFEHLSTRGRVFWLVIASALPLLLLSVYVALDQRAGEEARARVEIEHHAELIATALDGMEINRLPVSGTIRLGRGEAAVILGAGGGVLAHYAGRGVRDELPSRATLHAVEGAAGAAIELPDATGAVRLYALKNAAMNPDRSVPVKVLVNVPEAVVHEAANRVFLQTLIGIAVVTLSLMACAWYGAERLVLKPIRTMLQMATKVRAGDLAARTCMHRSREELSQLGSALDDMAEQLEARDSKLREALEELRTQALTDPLTGLYNRRYLTETLTRELLAAQRKPSVFSVVLMDLDRFKNVNDTWGHDAGDAVLRAIADLLRASIRGSDIAVRYGGEEFALLLPGTNAAIAQERAENLRLELQAQGVTYGHNTIRITASFGVAEYDGSAIDIEELMRRVDAALYAAKSAGRNTVRLHRPLEMESRAFA